MTPKPATEKTAGTAETMLSVPLANLHPSPLNPRVAYPPDGLKELGASLKARQLVPLLVREIAKKPGHYEIAAGHRRKHAAALAQVPELLCRVLEMDDATFCEALATEQLQHEDFTPLEEGQSYANLQRVAKLSVAQIAEKVKKEIRVVTDRMRLLELVPAAKKALLAGEIRLEHATILARLEADDQKAAIESGLYEREAFFGTEGGMKVRSPRELQGWIDQHVRLKIDAVAADLFPDTVEAVTKAEAGGVKIVAITYEHVLAPSAKGEERTIGPRGWRPVGAKQCEHAVLGVVKAGQNRGQSFPVCIEKKKCRTHWGDEIKTREKSAKAEKSGDQQKIDAAQAKQKADEEAREKARERWMKAAPAIAMALVAKLQKANVTPKGLGEMVMPGHRGEPVTAKAIALLAKPKTCEDLVRLQIADRLLGNVYNAYTAERHLADACKLLGVDAKPILDNVAPLEKKAAPAKKAAAKKAPAKKPSKKK